MASFYSTLLGEVQLPPDERVVIGGPWPGARVVVTDITILDIGADATGTYVFGTSDSASIAGWFEPGGSLGSLYWHGRQVLSDGDSLSAYSNGTVTTVRVSGWVLLPFA